MKVDEDVALPNTARDTDDVVIAFMGTTGSGKSSFVQAITGRNDIVGDGLQSGTFL